MITVPIYDMILLPGVSFYFKKEVYDKWQADSQEPEKQVMFLLMRNQKNPDEISDQDFYPVGFVAEVVDDVATSAEGLVQLRVKHRVNVSDIEEHEGRFSATASVRRDTDLLSEEERTEQFLRLHRDYLQFVQGFQWGIWVQSTVQRWTSVNEMLCSSAGYMNLSWAEKYAIMAEDSERKRSQMIEDAIYEFIAAIKVGEEAQGVQQEGHEKAYREQAIKKQINYLQQQLDEMHPDNVTDVQRFEQAIADSGMNETARKEAEKILNRMKQEGQDGHEYGIHYDYLDFVTGLSWKKAEMKEIDLAKVEEVLDEDHYGLKKVKDRIVQQMAVMALNKKQSGSILLFVGAPGTGKTSIGQSIARSLGREYVRISLGGVRDEAEIRGHRRTYVGAMPGRIMEGMKRSGASNPVMVLDEVDKLSKDYSGDPASALLEVLDPEQNSNFTDHYMNVPYDLSDVLFVCTANSTDTIPEPLLNRMEVIQFPGYTAVEKFQIARKHLIPNIMEETGIKAKNLKITDKALKKIIAEYTAESGVRGLKKQIGTVCRQAAVRLVRNEQKSVSVGEKKLKDFLGNPPLHHDKKLEAPVPGVMTGLAWTSAGGEVLFIESRLIEGKEDLLITGQLGDVMKESVLIALSLVKSMYPEEAKQLKDHRIHLHVPAGAVPKDGPSAGVTIVTALVSLLTGKGVNPEYAMTGEVSLRGTVMPIGGLPEKLMAAQRAGITKVFIPSDNVIDLEEVADEVKEKLEIVPVKTVKELLELIFE